MYLKELLSIFKKTSLCRKIYIRNFTTFFLFSTMSKNKLLKKYSKAKLCGEKSIFSKLSNDKLT